MYVIRKPLKKVGVASERVFIDCKVLGTTQCFEVSFQHLLMLLTTVIFGVEAYRFVATYRASRNELTVMILSFPRVLFSELEQLILVLVRVL